MDEIEQHREAQVTKTEFNELKEIVKALGQTTNRLAQAQGRTEKALESLTIGQKSAETDISELKNIVKNLAKAQERTEAAIESLAKAQEQTENTVRNTWHPLSGVSKSMAYALENEAFGKWRAYLKSHHQLDISKHFVRTYVGDEEINIFAKANRENCMKC